MSELRVVIAPASAGTRILAVDRTSTEIETRLKARLRTEPSHPRALQWFLESLALWQGSRVHAALVADEREPSCATMLYGDWFPDFDGTLYTLEIAERAHRGRRRARRDVLEGMGSYGDLRQLELFMGECSDDLTRGESEDSSSLLCRALESRHDRGRARGARGHGEARDPDGWLADA